VATVLAGEDLTQKYAGEIAGVLIRKSADESVNNSVAMQDDNELKWPLSANLTYTFLLFIAYDSSTVADIKIQFTLPAGATMAWHGTGLDTALAYKNVANIGAATASAYGGAGAGLGRLITVSGSVIMAATAGNLTLQWAQNTAEASNTSVRAGSYGLVFRA
jgi:hypothetical protein